MAHVHTNKSFAVDTFIQINYFLYFQEDMGFRSLLQEFRMGASSPYAFYQLVRPVNFPKISAQQVWVPNSTSSLRLRGTLFRTCRFVRTILRSIWLLLDAAFLEKINTDKRTDQQLAYGHVSRYTYALILVKSTFFFLIIRIF